jgi:hypothetical protein
MESITRSCFAIIVFALSSAACALPTASVESVDEDAVELDEESRAHVGAYASTSGPKRLLTLRVGGTYSLCVGQKCTAGTWRAVTGKGQIVLRPTGGTPQTAKVGANGTIVHEGVTYRRTKVQPGFGPQPI